MTVNELSNNDFLTPVVICDTGTEISGVYIGDLLSWVMNTLQEGQLWVKIMSNINILAVAFILSPGYSVFLKIRTDFHLAYAKKGADDIPGQGQNTAKAVNTASAKQLKKNGFA